MTKLATTADNRYISEVRHPLTLKDQATAAAMRIQVAPSKGKMSGPEARAPFDEVMEHVPDASGVQYTQGVVGGVPGTWCRPPSPRPDAAILYLHGGAYVLGSAFAYRHFVGQIAARTGVAAFVADYRLAPEHVFPAAIDDARAAYAGLVHQGARVIAIAGDSAGGGLALSLLAIEQAAAQNGDGVAACAAAVMSPWTDLALTGASLEDRAEDDPLVTKNMLSIAASSYLVGHDPYDPMVSPLYADLSGLPPVQIHVGTSEVLLDDARRYGDRFREAGGDAVAHTWEGMMHVFPSNLGALEASDAAMALVANFLKDKLQSRSEAARIRAYGGTDAVQFEETTVAVAGPKQVVVRVAAAGINGLDWKIRDGLLKDAFPLAFPATLGFELAGTIVAVGAGTSRLKLGDRVIGTLDGIGAYADFVAVDEAKLALSPRTLSDVEAAALPVAALTAWQALEAGGGPRAGQKILVQGAAGSVGGFAVQFAKAAGATVIATASASAQDHVRALGVDEAIDYRSERFEDRASAIDIVLDFVGGETLERSWAVLSPTGIIVSSTQPDLAARVPVGRRGTGITVHADAERLAKIAADVETGRVKSTIAEICSRSELAAAIERNKTGHAPGKMVADFTR
jgi:NADPH:quinone reductase-like Zn-dependent oxidoreductase/acetyl esterase/lipase